MAHCEDDGHWCPDCHMETRPSEVRSDALFGVSDPCKTCSDRDKAGDDEPCASCGPPAWEYHDCRCEDDDTPNAEAHGRRSRTVQPLVGHSGGET